MIRAGRKDSRLPGWLVWGFAGIAAGIVLLALPAQYEGPLLVLISPGHGLSVLDTIALLPLLSGFALVYRGLWQRRDRLVSFIRRSPGTGMAATLLAGFGLGLLLASVLATFFWWWAIGALLFQLMLIAAVIIAMR